MRNKKYYIVLDDFELLERNAEQLISDSKYTDAVDKVLLKIFDAKQKKFKVIYKEA